MGSKESKESKESKGSGGGSGANPVTGGNSANNNAANTANNANSANNAANTNTAANEEPAYEPRKVRKPVILFYNFEGPFTCSIKTRTPECFTCFPKPISEDRIEWKGEVRQDKLLIEGQYYPYLFWESETIALENLKPHFRSSRKDMAVTVFDLLRRLGLNEQQATNFVTYWIYRWQKSESWLIHVLSEKTIDQLFPLSITPKPSQTKRIYLIFGEDKGAKELQPFEVVEWKMTNQSTVVEWGSAEHEF